MSLFLWSRRHFSTTAVACSPRPAFSSCVSLKKQTVAPRSLTSSRACRPWIGVFFEVSRFRFLEFVVVFEKKKAAFRANFLINLHYILDFCPGALKNGYFKNRKFLLAIWPFFDQKPRYRSQIGEKKEPGTRQTRPEFSLFRSCLFDRVCLTWLSSAKPANPEAYRSSENGKIKIFKKSEWRSEKPQVKKIRAASPW